MRFCNLDDVCGESSIGVEGMDDVVELTKDG